MPWLTIVVSGLDIVQTTVLTKFVGLISSTGTKENHPIFTMVLLATPTILYLHWVKTTMSALE